MSAQQLETKQTLRNPGRRRSNEDTNRAYKSFSQLAAKMLRFLLVTSNMALTITLIWGRWTLLPTLCQYLRPNQFNMFASFFFFSMTTLFASEISDPVPPTTTWWCRWSTWGTAKRSRQNMYL